MNDIITTVEVVHFEDQYEHHDALKGSYINFKFAILQALYGPNYTTEKIWVGFTKATTFAEDIQGPKFLVKIHAPTVFGDRLKEVEKSIFNFLSQSRLIRNEDCLIVKWV